MTIGESLREKGIEIPKPTRFLVEGSIEGTTINVIKPRYLRQTEADRYHEEEATLP